MRRLSIEMNLLDALRADHRAFLALLERLDRSVTSSSSRFMLPGSGERLESEAAQLIRELIERLKRHEGVEEGLLWPAMRRLVPEAAAALQVMEADHAGLRAVLGTFERELSAAGHSPAWLILGVSRMANMVRSHIAREEADLFSIAARRIPAAELERLGADIQPAGGPRSST